MKTTNTYTFQPIKLISTNQKLWDILQKTTPQFRTLLQLLPPKLVLELNRFDKKFCKQTYCLDNKVNKYENYENKMTQIPKSMVDLLDELINICQNDEEMKDFIQVRGQQFHDIRVKYFSLSTPRGILQTHPTFLNLFNLLDTNSYLKLLINNSIIINYKGSYLQITGKLISQLTGLADRKLTNERQIELKSNDQKFSQKSANKQSANKQQKQQKQNKFLSKKIEENGLKGYQQKSQTDIIVQLLEQQQEMQFKPYFYGRQQLKRSQLFYCGTYNKHTGIFSKNLFFDKGGLKKSQYTKEVEHLVKKLFKSELINKIPYQESQIQLLFPAMCDLFQKVRKNLHTFQKRGKHTSKFNAMIAFHCPLPKNYHQIKKNTKQYENEQILDPSEIFNQLYNANSQYLQVYGLLKQFLEKSIPIELIGTFNKKIFITLMKKFISMKRFQMMKMEQILNLLNVFQVKWLQLGFSKLFKKDIIVRGRKYLSIIITFLINQLILPILKYNFYITQRHKDLNKIFYYRKPLWGLISRLAVKKFSEDNLEILSKNEVEKNKERFLHYPLGKLRILPKKGTFRPIVTFNRKIQQMYDPLRDIKILANLNEILSDVRLILRNVKVYLGENYADNFGYSIFDNRQIMRKFDNYIIKWRQMGCPKLHFFTLDIKKCYDSIDSSKLLSFIFQSQFVSEMYTIYKYHRLFRNKKALQDLGKKIHISGYMNFKQRLAAKSFSDDFFQIKEQSKVPSINMFLGQHKTMTKQEMIDKLQIICDGSIIQYRNHFWRQKRGIPQGLNVSGVLCSLYFSFLEEKYLKVKEGLLMRLTDDYFYIGPESQSGKILDQLSLCAKQNDFTFSFDKLFKNFNHPISDKILDVKQIVWIGKRINLETLEVQPYNETLEKLSYSMNVNFNMKCLKPFLRNKFKSLLTNHFYAYYKPKLFSFEQSSKIVKIYVQISLEKFIPFIVDFLKYIKTESNKKYIRNILLVSLRQFVVYACLIAQNADGQKLYNRLFIEVCKQAIKFFDRKSGIYDEMRYVCAILKIEKKKLELKLENENQNSIEVQNITPKEKIQKS